MPVLIEAMPTLHDEFAQQQLKKIYDASLEFSDGEQALTLLKSALEQNTTLYVAIFNQRITGAIWVVHHADTRLLKHIAIHPANRGRGISERLVSEVCRLEREQGAVTFEAGCGAIAHILQKLL